MDTKLRRSLKSYLERNGGGSLTEGNQTKLSENGIESVDIFNFDHQNVVFICTQISAPLLTVNMIEASFRFPTYKKQERSKLHGVVNAFNKSKIAMKACLSEVEKSHFDVNFSVEFICPDQSIVDDMIHPAVNVLRTCGRLLLMSLGSHGISIKDK